MYSHIYLLLQWSTYMCKHSDLYPHWNSNSQGCQLFYCGCKLLFASRVALRFLKNIPSCTSYVYVQLFFITDDLRSSNSSNTTGNWWNFLCRPSGKRCDFWRRRLWIFLLITMTLVQLQINFRYVEELISIFTEFNYCRFLKINSIPFAITFSLCDYKPLFSLNLTCI